MAVTIKGFASDWSVPTQAQEKLRALFPTKMPKTLNVRDYGAHGSNTVDNAAFLGAATVARDSRRTSPDGLATDPLGTATIDLPAGDFRITEIGGLLGAESTTTKIRGLKIRGAGSDQTQIIFDPATAGALMANTYWQNIKFEGITFSVTKPDCTFMHSVNVSGSAAQDYTFTDVKWNGQWKYVFNLQGGNNNSEFYFYKCATTLMQGDGAFLYIGTDNTSDQFVNYYFYGFKHQATLAPMIDAAKGGHFHLFGVDVSGWGASLTAKKYVINLRGAVHGHGVQTLTAQGLRVEAKNALAGLLYSEWSDGNVNIQVDWSSQVSSYTYGDIVEIGLSSVSGPVYNFHDSHLAGGVKVTWWSETWRRQPAINFTNCMWRQRLTPSEVVTHVAPSTNPSSFKPPVSFIRCRGENQEATSTGGASVWDAVVGHATASLVQSSGPRALTIRGAGGMVKDGETVKVNLPVGAYITGVRAVSPTTISTDADGATWTVATTEATPATVASVGVTSALGNGYNTPSPAMVPFRCATRERATVTVKSTGNPFPRPEAFLVVEGYW